MVTPYIIAVGRKRTKFIVVAELFSRTPYTRTKKFLEEELIHIQNSLIRLKHPMGLLQNLKGKAQEIVARTNMCRYKTHAKIGHTMKKSRMHFPGRRKLQQTKFHVVDVTKNTMPSQAHANMNTKLISDTTGQVVFEQTTYSIQHNSMVTVVVAMLLC